MLQKIIYKDDVFEWVDIQDLQITDIPDISTQYGINFMHLEDCINSNHLPKAEDLGEIKFILTRCSYDPKRKSLNSINDVSTKLGIFIKENLILTIHRVDNKGITKVLADLENKKISKPNPYKVARGLGLEVLKTFNKENLVLIDRMENIENDIFTKDNISGEIKRLYRFKRRVNLNLKLLNLSNEWVNFYAELPIKQIEAKDLKDSYIEAVSEFEYLNSQATNLINLYLAISDQKNNESMKILAVYSAYFLPITFLASLYGMNFTEMVGINHRYGFYIMLGLMAVIVVVTSIFMKRKKVK